MLAVCTIADQGSRAGTTRSETCLAEIFRDRDGAGEQLLLVVAENLLRGQIVGGGAELADAGRHHDNVLFLGVDALQRPLQVVQRVVIADRHHHVARTQCPGSVRSTVSLCSRLEVFLHVLFGERMLAAVDALGDGEDQERTRGKGHAAMVAIDLVNRFTMASAKQHQKNRRQSDRNFDGRRS